MNNNSMPLWQWPSHQPLAADVVIIGSGAGGAVAAEVLAQAGLSVLIFEHGPHKQQSDFKMQEQFAYPDLYQDAAARKTKDKAISILQGRAVGGSTTVNWTTSLHTPEPVLNYWASELGLTGLGSAELAPWYRHAEQRLHIAPWPVPPNGNNEKLRQGCDTLGWTSKVIPRNVHGCANLGYCGMGCPLNAKQSMLVTCIPAALAAGARLFSQAWVHSIAKRGDGYQLRVHSVDDLWRPTTKSYPVLAKQVIVAGGAINSPAVLLRSGFGKALPQLGKRTFLHPSSISAAVFAEPIAAHSGAPQSIYSDQFLFRDGVQGELGYKLEVPPLHPVLFASKIPMHGAAHRQLMQQFNHVQAIIALHRDGFNPDSQGGRVQLMADGMPLLDYPITSALLRAVRHSVASMVECQFAAGAKQVLPLDQSLPMLSSWTEAKAVLSHWQPAALRTSLASAHVMGGCAMGSSTATGVVNEQGQLLADDGIWVFDGSALPTSLGANPQLTLYALAYKNATRLAQQLTGHLTLTSASGAN